MSNVKVSERKPSDLEVFHQGYKIRNAITELAANDFHIRKYKIDEHVSNKLKNYPQEQQNIIKVQMYNFYNRQVIRIEDNLINKCIEMINYLRNANTIYPINMSEYEERRLYLDRAMGCCWCLQDELQYCAESLFADVNKYEYIVKDIRKEYNLIKGLRQSDNRFLRQFTEDKV